MTRTKTYAAVAGAAALGALMLASVASAKTEGEDPLLTPRMRELKRLRAELARLQAEIPRATVDRKYMIESELIKLDRKLEALQNTPADRAPSAIDGWTPILESVLDAQPGRVYAGVVQLGWFAALVVSAATIERELRKAVPWTSLLVSGAPMPAGAAKSASGAAPPWTLEDASGRYWIVGTPAKAYKLARPSQLLEAYVSG
ncbi:MAG TPA: hypothetical protein VFN67_37435 [Polyangiales bacterium]|nr:hypothetical protein [Polyangiales bacterium]